MFTSKKTLPALAATALMLAASGCIKNDLPYPHIQANFTSFTVEQMASPAVIDTVAMTVTLPMDEEADLSRVRIESYEVSPAQVVLNRGETVPTVLDLTTPWEVDLTLYQTYTWTVSATQDIQRYFTVDGQIGRSVIDADHRTVVARVPETADLGAIRVLTIKLGARGSVCEPQLGGATVDFRRPVTVTVTTHGVAETWTVSVVTTDATVAMTAIDGWSRVAWLYANVEAGSESGFEYRRKSDPDWSAVPDEWISAEGGSLKARLTGLSPLTEYEARAYSNGVYSDAMPFATEGEEQMPNSDFSQWWKNGAVWNPWPEGGTSFWDTGNKGAATIGLSNSVPTDQTLSGEGLCAELQSKFVGIAGIGKLAAGNIFTGEYYRTDGTNGILHMGRPWSLRPTRLTGWMHYNCAPISAVGSDPEFRDWKNRPDTAQIYFLLADWDEAFEVRTNPKNRQLVNPQDPGVVAYGKVEYGQSVEQWSKFTVELDYRSTSRVPRYILVVCTSSKYGDYFVGGNGSVLYIDNLKLEYDY